jgi:8-oxo-dGTP pyrophosphatase MutT (NUDIX family)
MAPARWIAAPAAVARIAARLERALAPPTETYLPWTVKGRAVGWITRQRALRLEAWRDVFVRGVDGIALARSLASAEARTRALDRVARTLAAEGALTAWRNERYAVTAADGDPPLLELERAAARFFGIHTYAAHANGLVRQGGGWRMWLARRSPMKAIDPGLLDNLVGGGIAAGSDAPATLVREAFEEAGIPAGLARRARSLGSVEIRRDRPDGLQRETIHVYDLWLPQDFVPRNQDGEAVEHSLCAPDALLSILETDDITADASLVIVDFLLRHGAIAGDDPGFEALAALRHARWDGPASPTDRSGP